MNLPDTVQKPLSGYEMTKDDLPDINDAEAIFEFAMTFNGYEHFGSFEKCSEAANARSRSSLEDIRNELFFCARASRHRGDREFVERYAELLPYLERFA